MGLAANSSAVYFAIMASAIENYHANMLGVKTLETEVGYRQDDILPRAKEELEASYEAGWTTPNKAQQP